MADAPALTAAQPAGIGPLARRRPARWRGLIAGCTLLVSSSVLGGAPAPVRASAQAVGTHATTGVIASLTETRLVITRDDRPAIAFTLTHDTFLDAGLAVGVEVSVRYRPDGDDCVATAVTRRHAGGS